MLNYTFDTRTFQILGRSGPLTNVHDLSAVGENQPPLLAEVLIPQSPLPRRQNSRPVQISDNFSLVFPFHDGQAPYFEPQ